MGYYTHFYGRFSLNRKPSERALANIEVFQQHSNWNLTTDQLNLEGEGGKAYDYEYELQWLIDYILEPDGIIVKGKLLYSGDDPEDIGYLIVDSNKVIKEECILVPRTAIEAFRPFLAQEPYQPTIIANTAEYQDFEGPELPFENEVVENFDAEKQELLDLREFKKFVLKSEYSREIIREWQRKREED